MNPRVLLTVDTSNLVYKSTAINATLRSEDRFTGGLYGFLGALAKAILFTGATEVVLCKDSKPYIRSKTYPEYKQLRAAGKDEDLALRARETMGYVDEAADCIGVPVWALPGFESDDLVAHAACKYRHRYSRIVVASNDSDLFQLFRYHNFQVWKGKAGLYDRAAFDKEWGMSPDKVVLALAMTGTHNEVTGIYGMGPVTAKRCIERPDLLRQVRQKHLELIERNIGLIQLPHPEFPAGAVLPGATKKFNERKFLQFCGKFDIDTTKAMLDAFGQLQ